MRAGIISIHTRGKFSEEDLEKHKPKKKKKHDRSSIDSMSNFCTNPDVSKNPVEEPNENIVKKKKYKSNEIADTTLESNNIINNENTNTQKPKKKKKHDRSSIDSMSNFCMNPDVSKNPVEEPNENIVKKKKYKSNEIADTTLESNNIINNENTNTQKPKKKKKDDRNSVDSTSKYSAYPQISKELVEISKPKKKKKHDRGFIDPISNYSSDLNLSKNIFEESNENVVKRKKYISNEVADATLESNNYVKNDDTDSQKRKKKKKYDRNSMDSTTNYNADPYVSSEFVEISNDITSEKNNYSNGEDLEVPKIKKKKKHDRSSIYPFSYYSTDLNLSQKIIEESNDNIFKKKKYKSNEVADATLESNNIINNENTDTQKPKKKKKHDRNSVDSTSKYSAYPQISKELVEISKPKKKKKHDRGFIDPISNYSSDLNLSKNIFEESNENVVKRKKYISNEVADATLESNNYFKNDDTDSQKRKKKKKHDRNSMDSTTNYNADPYVSSEFVEISNDITSEKNNYSNREDLEVPKPKKKKKHDKKSIDPISNSYIDFNLSKNIIEESNENIVKKKKKKSNRVTDASLESNNYVDNDDRDTQKPKKKKKHNRNYMDSTSNYNADPYVSSKLVEISNDITLEKSSFFNEEDLKVPKTKKKKKHDRSFMDSISDYSTDFNISKNIIEEFNENVVKKKKKKSNQVIDVILKSNDYVSNDDIDIHKPKKKKKHDRISVDSTNNFNADSYESSESVEISNDITLEKGSYFNGDNFEVPQINKKKKHDRSSMDSFSDFCRYLNLSKNIIEESSGNIIKKKKNESDEVIDITLESNNFINNENTDTLIPKKKKKHDKNSIDSSSNYRTDPYISKKLIEISNDISLDESSYFNREYLEKPKPKKKKKHDRSSIDPISIYSSDHNVYETMFEESNQNVVKKRKYKNNEVADTTSETYNYINNEDTDTPIPKKKKKHDNNSMDTSSNYCGDSYVSTELIEISNNITLGKSNYFNGEDLESPNTKEKKKHDRNSIDPISNHSTDLNLSKDIIEESNKNIGIKRKYENNEVANTTSESNNFIDNEDTSTKIPKKKKKHDRNSIDPISNHSTDLNLSKDIIEESNKNIGIKRKYENNEVANTTLESNNFIDNEDTSTKIPKKKKKYDRNSIDPISNNSTDLNVSKNILEESNENIVNKKKYENNELGVTTLENNYYINNEDTDTQNSIKNEVFDRKSVDSTSSCSEDSSVIENLGEFNVSGNITDVIKNIRSLQQNLVVPKVIDESFDKNGETMNELTLNEGDSDSHVKSEDDNNLISTIFQENKLIEEILQAIHLCELENPPTTENKVILGEFDLIQHIINSYPAINDHKESKLLITLFSKFMKTSINLDGPAVTQSDIVLLTTIGKSILDKMLNAYDMFKVLKNDLRIELPPECQNNTLHYVETGLVCKRDTEKLNLIKKLNPDFKYGQFSKDEDNIIKKYWLKFAQEYNVSDPRPFLSTRGGLTKLSLPTKIKMQFVRYISVELPNRLLSSVYNRFNVLYSKQANKLSFSENEDKIIMIVNNCGAIKNKIALLCSLLNRSKGQIFRRIHSFKMKPLRGKYISWDIDKLQVLFDNVLLETNTTNWKDLKDIKIKQDTWIKISKNFDEAINYEKCQTHWNSLKTRLFCETPIKYSTFKVIVLEMLLKINPKYWSDLNWVEITNKLYPGANVKVINTIFHWWITSKVPKEIRENVQATLKYLATNCLDSEIKKIQLKVEKEVSRLTVKDNVLVEVK